MELASKYNPTEIESKWYQYWLDNGFFSSKPDGREPYTVVIPPPNVTGVLHMGHMLNNTIQDVLVRRARMQGKNACWVPGTDHASIATEAKVVAKLAAEGRSKSKMSREDFLIEAKAWKDKHGGIILEQLKKLGASCDWDRTAFTMDEPRSESVLKVFVDLYNKGLIYRGVRMVNWDPKALTALSDEEVIHKEVNGKLYYIKYQIEGENGYAVVATTRPETIFGDVAVCINPNDEKTASFKGKKLIVPIVNRVVPVIEDEYVDINFGTGFLKVTPAHDINDYMLGEKFGLEKIDIFNDNGTLNGLWDVHQPYFNLTDYIGMDRFEARKQIEKDLEAVGLLEKTEPYTNKVGFSERTDVVIEPKLSMQWFLKMEDLAKPALDAVMNDDIQLYPAKFKNTYRHWMENVKDWCISRQLWWGHRIPVWYYQEEKSLLYQFPFPTTAIMVAENENEAISKIIEVYKSKGYNEAEINELLLKVRQDEDCLDTWFSSWLWPISVFDGINNPENEEINYYYPTNDLVTAPEILFFWVARMIIAGYEYKGEMPFKNVYLTGIVRDKLGRKMSKSLGNSPDPLDLIAHYGADAVRLGMLLTSPAGNDLPYDDSLCEQGRNFNNKIWNAFRLVKGWEVADIEQPESARMAVKWFDAQLNKTLIEIDDLFSKYRLSEALMAVYKLFWDEFSSWYLEMAKPAYQKPIDRTTYEATLGFFDSLLKVLHPFMPFITEELWQALEDRKEGESIMVVLQPKATEVDDTLIANFEYAKEIIAGIRTVRLQKNIPNKEVLSLQVIPSETATQSGSLTQFNAVIAKLGNLETIEKTTEKAVGSVSFLVGTTEFAIPMGSLINAEEEIAKMEAEIVYYEGFIESVMKKLGNERFVANAKPEIVEAERKKKADAESKIASLKEGIAGLRK
ncbi:MAG: valine--tRNA ligase [Paludibacter sp.]|nr:valine--tRNA ligase [Paludibacter sp.]